MGVNRSDEFSRRSLLGSASTIATSMVLATALPRSAASQTSREPLMAIDTLLDPDQTMVQKAIAANERLVQSFPKGFALDETHQPHISTLQRYVRTADLDNVYGAVGKILADEHPAGWKLTAYKYYFIPWKSIGLAGIVVRPTDDLRRFQQKLIDAITPFTVKTGTATAFVTTKEDPNINKPTIDYVAHYVPADSKTSLLSTRTIRSAGACVCMTHIRTVCVTIVVAVILITVVVRISARPASTTDGARPDVPQAGISIAKPEGMKQFPPELIPMP